VQGLCVELIVNEECKVCVLSLLCMKSVRFVCQAYCVERVQGLCIKLTVYEECKVCVLSLLCMKSVRFVY
jgi:hypothetical protein